jgi:SOS-response transcriptional repressor LexA
MHKDENEFGSEADTTGVSAHTGFPNPATDKSLHTLDFNQLLIQHAASTFMFRIRGHEWEDSGVFDGDIAVIDRALDARKADVVIWWQENHEAFSLSYYRNVPADATVWGVVTATIHQFRAPRRGNP